jgi:hypothetical protein
MTSRGVMGTVVGLLVAVAGCTTWRRDADVLTAPIPNRRPVQIWSGNRALVAHGVQIHDDSVRAVPRWKPPECETCARYLTLRAIDSVRVHRVSAVRTGALIAVVVGLLYLTAGLGSGGGPGS